MTTTDRISWIATKYGGYTGHVGTLEPWLFQIWRCGDCSGEWSLMASLPGQPAGDHFSGDETGELKQRAEDMLSDLAASLGASFPEAEGRWSALRTAVTADRAIYDDEANDHSDMSGDAHRDLAERCWGAVAECDRLLKLMDEMEAGR